MKYTAKIVFGGLGGLLLLGLLFAPFSGLALARAESVGLVWHYQYTSQNNPEAPIIWGLTTRFQNSGHRTEKVILNLSLHNERGVRLNQANLTATIAPGAWVTHQLTSPANLPAGTYHWRGAVLKPNGKVLERYGRIAEFRVN